MIMHLLLADMIVQGYQDPNVVAQTMARDVVREPVANDGD